MKFLDRTSDAPAANLAMDEALLDAVEEGAGDAAEGVLRFYESPVPFVVVGFGNRVATEVNLEACRVDGVPVLRRSSGGGTVVLGPGCLAYALALPVSRATALESVTATNRFVMECHRDALESLLQRPVAVRGHTDLTLGELKFSGNAQRRRRKALLFHGTFLLNFDLAQIGRWLRAPSIEPEYRAGRDHARFVVNLGVDADRVKSALAGAWGASQPLSLPLEAGVQRWLRDRYGRADWHERS